MSEAKLLKRVRRYALWSVIDTAALLIILSILETWGAIDFIEEPSIMGRNNPMDLGGLAGLIGEPTAWGKLQASLMTVLGFAVVVILAMLFASLIRDRNKKKGCDEPAPMKAPAKAPAKKR
jgi:hypothetical protein